jgi:hypothetical protein
LRRRALERSGLVLPVEGVFVEGEIAVGGERAFDGDFLAASEVQVPARQLATVLLQHEQNRKGADLAGQIKRVGGSW